LLVELGPAHVGPRPGCEHVGLPGALRPRPVVLAGGNRDEIEARQDDRRQRAAKAGTGVDAVDLAGTHQGLLDDVVAEDHGPGAVVVLVPPAARAELGLELALAGRAAAQDLLLLRGERYARLERRVHDDRIGQLEVVRQRGHPLHDLGVRRAELELRDLLRIREHAAHVLALVVAGQDDAVPPLAEQLHDLGGLGAAIDEITDGDQHVIVDDRELVAQLDELAMATVDIADYDLSRDTHASLLADATITCTTPGVRPATTSAPGHSASEIACAAAADHAGCADDSTQSRRPS